MAKKTVLVLFGGKAPEHEISIITGIQVLHALDKTKYEVIPVYVTKKGDWILGGKSFFKVETFRNLDKLEKEGHKVYLLDRKLVEISKVISFFKARFLHNVDVIFPAFHGRYGEDGAVQGLFELGNLPYVGSDVEASAIGMDKIISKKVAKSIGVPTLADNWCNKNEWLKDESASLRKLMAGLKFPLFVKPVRLGSSIGISKVSNLKELRNAINLAFFYDTKVMVEEALENAKEINVSLIGNGPYEYSVCEQPISSSDILSFEDKYISSKGQSKGMASLKRILPAKIKKQTEERIKKYAGLAFSEMGGQGIARVDFLVSKDEKLVYFNEVNTLPGSFAFYLWKEKGVSFNKLADKLIELALRRHEEKGKLTLTFQSNVLKGFKGAKLSKS